MPALWAGEGHCGKNHDAEIKSSKLNYNDNRVKHLEPLLKLKVCRESMRFHSLFILTPDQRRQKAEFEPHKHEPTNLEQLNLNVFNMEI